MSAKCSGCGLFLRDHSQYPGVIAFHPRTGEECKRNFYGGFVCSPDCDKRATKTMHESQDSYVAHKAIFGGD